MNNKEIIELLKDLDFLKANPHMIDDCIKKYKMKLGDEEE